jgi:hypothetical protein
MHRVKTPLGECLLLSEQNMPNVTIPTAVANADDILQRIAEGERIRDIAADYGRSGPSVSIALSRHMPQEYDAALKAQAEIRLERFEEALETAPDGLSVSRAREVLAHQRWKLERLNPARWGQVKQAIQVNSDGATSINIVSYADSSIESGT